MDSQRRQAYLELIQTLLNSPSGQEEILQAHREPVEQGLVQVMLQEAAKLTKLGRWDNANLLMNLAGQLMGAGADGNTPLQGQRLWKNATESASNHSESLQEVTEADVNSLVEILQAVESSNADPQVVYSLLQQHLAQLDDHFARVLQVWAEFTLPKMELERRQAIAEVIWNFSNLMCKFPLGNRATNVEIAIIGYEIALNVYTRDRFPVEWVMLQNNLGLAYRERIRGERADNLEQVIACQQALEEYTRDRFPLEWAMTQNNLGLAYYDRIRGERADNLEQAIACHQQALEELTRARFPVDWAMTQYNLGNAYFNRIRGEHADNLEQAIVCHHQALEEYTRDRFPVDWANTQYNLGNAYSQRIRGERADNLEQAIVCYHQALEEYTRDRFPVEWALTQNYLGIAYSNRIRGERADNLTQAFNCYQQSLLIYTPTTFPLNCLTSGRHLGNTAFTAGQWARAINGYAVAIEALEISRSWATNEERRQEILAESIGVYENMVQACINNGQLDKALEYVERSRSKRLVDLMASNDLYSDGNIPPQVQDYLQQYEQLQQQIDQERNRPDTDTTREPVGHSALGERRAAFKAKTETIQALEAQKQEVWTLLRQLDPVLAGSIQVSAPDLSAMQQLIADQPQTAIVSFYTTTNDTHIFVLGHNNITCHTCAGQGLEALQIWIYNNWLLTYVNDKPIWRQQIPTFLTELGERLQLPDLIANHLTGVTELILVPHLYLHQIPFAALRIGESQFLGDSFLLRTVPSCQVLELCKKRLPLGANAFQQTPLLYGTVEDATEDLPCTPYECEQIAQLYHIPDLQRLKGRHQATVKNYQHLARTVQGIHSSHHATSRLDNPLESALQLGDGVITLGMRLNLGFVMQHVISRHLAPSQMVAAYSNPVSLRS